MSISNLDVPKTSRFGSATIAIFCAAIFTSASLLFFVQPLFAKLVLPKIGGAPAVWTTAMLFFQVVLILGYVYAHLLTKFLPLRWQIIAHFAFWVAALTFLPLSTSESWSYDASTSTALQTLGLFAVGVGVPFAVLSANAPLLQAWYASRAGLRRMIRISFTAPAISDPCWRCWPSPGCGSIFWRGRDQPCLAGRLRAVRRAFA